MPRRVAYLVRQPTAGVEVGDTDFDSFSSLLGAENLSHSSHRYANEIGYAAFRYGLVVQVV